MQDIHNSHLLLPMFCKIKEHRMLTVRDVAHLLIHDETTL